MKGGKKNMKQSHYLTGFAIAQTILLTIIVFQMIGLNEKIGDAGGLPAAVRDAPVAAAPSPPAARPAAPAPRPSIDMDALVGDDDPVLGNEDAPVTIIEWSDFQCPFCARFHTQTFSQIEEQYIKTGKVRFVYRDYPLPFHSNAQKAAEAGQCAHEQGKFWEMHDKIFANQGSMSVSNYKKWADELGLDTGEFKDCLDSGKTAEETAKDLREGSGAGISGTPGFLVNGRLVSGAQPFSAFQAAIEAALAE